LPTKRLYIPVKPADDSLQFLRDSFKHSRGILISSVLVVIGKDDNISMLHANETNDVNTFHNMESGSTSTEGNAQSQYAGWKYFVKKSDAVKFVEEIRPQFVPAPPNPFPLAEEDGCVLGRFMTSPSFVLFHLTLLSPRFQRQPR